MKAEIDEYLVDRVYVVNWGRAGGSKMKSLEQSKGKLFHTVIPLDFTTLGPTTSIQSGHRPG